MVLGGGGARYRAQRCCGNIVPWGHFREAHGKDVLIRISTFLLNGAERCCARPMIWAGPAVMSVRVPEFLCM